MYPLSTTPQSIARVLDNGIALYRQTFFETLPLTVLFSGFSYLTYFFLYAPTDFTPLLGLIHEYYWAYLGLQTILLSTTATGLLYRLHAFMHNIPCDNQTAFSIGLHKLIPFLLCLAFNTALLLGSMAPSLFPQYAFEPAVWLGSLACGVLSLYCLPSLLLVATHKILVLDALKRSIALMKGNLTRVGILLTVIIALYLAVAFTVSGAFLWALSFGGLVVDRPDLIQIGLQAFVGALFGSYLYCGLMTVLYDLQIRAQSRAFQSAG